MHALFLLTALSLAQAPPDHATALVLRHASVLSEDGESFTHDLDVLVLDRRIARIAPSGELDAPPAARRIDLSGHYLLPGLIDLHSHLLLHPYDEARWNDQVLMENLELRVLRAVPAARATLFSGFTTLRDLGTEGAAFADVSLRDAIATGLIEGPRVFAATRALVATGCYGPAGFDPRFDLPKGAQVADGVTGVRKAVREQVAAGADWIKVYADYRRRPGGPSTPTYSQDELDAIVSEAVSAGLQVAAHAFTDAAIRRAVQAGVRTIEHGYEASLATLRVMRQRGVVLCPTLMASYSTAQYAGWDGHDPEPERVRAARALIARALDAGVEIACGSDVGVFAHGSNARELELMVEYGMSPSQAIRAATRLAADVLRREDLGRIASAATADLIAVARDPLRDISALSDVRMVIKEGRVVRELAPPDGREIRALCEEFFAASDDGRYDDVANLFTGGAVVTLAGPSGGTYPAERFVEIARMGHLPADARSELQDVQVRQSGGAATVSVSIRRHADPGHRSRYGFQCVRRQDGWRIAALLISIESEERGA